MLERLSDFFWTAIPALLFSPFLLISATGSFFSSPLHIGGKHDHYLQSVINVICTALLFGIIYFIIRKQYVLASSLFIFGLALQSLAGYLPVLLNLPRELSSDGMTILLLPFAVMLFLAAGFLFASYFIK